jgi:perosamine synthetase
MKKLDIEIIKSIISTIKKVTKKKNVSKLHVPTLSKLEGIYLKKCLDTNMLSTIGPFVEIFENKLKKITKAKHVIATINGTSALHIALKLININKSSEVLIPSLNFVASTNATLYCDGTPHFIDVEEKTLGVDFDKLDNYLKKNTKQVNQKCLNIKTKKIIKAIIPTHLYGHPVNIKKLIILAKKYNLKIIEDAAEGVGSLYKGKHVGTFGDMGILSFNGNKTITTGGGGAILTNNSIIANKARHLISVSKEKKKFDLSHDQIGYNYKMTNLHAAIGCAQLQKMNKLLSNKKKLFKAFEKAFKSNENVTMFKQPLMARSNYWLNTILLKKTKSLLRNKILEKGKKSSIALRPAWKVLPELKFLKQYPKMNISQSKQLSKRIINLPSSSNLIN